MVISKEVLLGDTIENSTVPNRGTPIIEFPGWLANRVERVKLDKTDISRHTLFVGGTGAGKTNVIYELTRQLKSKMNISDTMIIFDTKRDFVNLHEKDDFVISNYDQEVPSECGLWNIFMEIVADGWSKEAIELNTNEIAELIFSDAISKSDDVFFPNAAKDLFAAIVKAITFIGIEDKQHRIKYMNNNSLRKYLSNVNSEMLYELLGKFPELKGVLKYIGDGNSEQALGVFAVMENVTSQLFRKGFGQDGRFSVRKFANSRGGKTLFVEYDMACGSSFLPIYRVLFDMFLKEGLSNRKKGNVYVICDELKLLPHLNHLEDALNFGRSIGVCVVAGIQSMEQLYEVYGEYGGKNIASAFQNTICFHTNNLATREYISGIHGMNYTAIQHTGASNNLREEVRLGHFVEDWDMTGLNVGEAIIGIAYEKPFIFKFGRYRS